MISLLRQVDCNIRSNLKFFIKFQVVMSHLFIDDTLFQFSLTIPLFYLLHILLNFFILNLLTLYLFITHISIKRQQFCIQRNVIISFERLLKINQSMNQSFIFENSSKFLLLLISIHLNYIHRNYLNSMKMTKIGIMIAAMLVVILLPMCQADTIYTINNHVEEKSSSESQSESKEDVGKNSESLENVKSLIKDLKHLVKIAEARNGHGSQEKKSKETKSEIGKKVIFQKLSAKKEENQLSKKKLIEKNDQEKSSQTTAKSEERSQKESDTDRKAKQEKGKSAKDQKDLKKDQSSKSQRKSKGLKQEQDSSQQKPLKSATNIAKTEQASSADSSNVAKPTQTSNSKAAPSTGLQSQTISPPEISQLTSTKSGATKN